MICHVSNDPEEAHNSYSVHFKGITRGEIIALHNALKHYSSVVSHDVKIALEHGIERSGDTGLQNLYHKETPKTP